MHFEGSRPVIVLLHALQKRVEIGLGGHERNGQGHQERNSGHNSVDAKTAPNVYNVRKLLIRRELLRKNGPDREARLGSGQGRDALPLVIGRNRNIVATLRFAQYDQPPAR